MRPGAAKGGAAGPIAVEVIQLKPTTVQEDLQAVGSLQSNESVILRPEVSGRISAIGFKDGQVVRKGQMLIALDNALNEAEVAQMKAEYDLALSNLKRSEDLASRKFISSSAQDTAASNAQVAEAKLKLAQARLSKMRIVAPFDGVVGIRGVSLGDYVKDGADLVNVEDVRTLKVDFRLPERNLTQIKVGQGIEVIADALPGERFAGQIDAINPRVDANGRSLEIRATTGKHRRQAAPRNVRARARDRRRAHQCAAGAGGSDRAAGRRVLRLQGGRWASAASARENRCASRRAGRNRRRACGGRSGRDGRHAFVARRTTGSRPAAGHCAAWHACRAKGLEGSEKGDPKAAPPFKAAHAPVERCPHEPLRAVHTPAGLVDGAVAAGARHRRDFVHAARRARISADRRAGRQRQTRRIRARRPT